MVVGEQREEGSPCVIQQAASAQLGLLGVG
jgi:hypothetical protein